MPDLNPGQWSAETYESQKEMAMVRFGRLIRRWRKANGWTQYIGERISRLGIQSLGPSNWSNIESATRGDLKPASLFKLAELNRRVAESDWPVITDHELKAWLADSRPITTDDGEIWGPSQFWEASVGLREPPEWLAEIRAPQITDADAVALSQRWRQEWQAALSGDDVDPYEELGRLSSLVPPEQRRRLRQVLTSGAFTAEELMASWDGDWAPSKALQQWAMQDLHNPRPCKESEENPVGA